jgi:hypothetical protein
MAEDEIVIVVLEADPREGARLVAALEKLDREGGAGPDLAAATRWLLASGQLTVANALEAIDTSERLATGKLSGEVTDEQAKGIIGQMAVRHATGVVG